MIERVTFENRDRVVGQRIVHVLLAIHRGVRNQGETNQLSGCDAGQGTRGRKLEQVPGGDVPRTDLCPQVPA